MTAMKGPASEKQKDYLEQLGYQGDLSQLTKAQASMMIDKLVAAREAANNPQRAASAPALPIALFCLALVLAGGTFAWYFGWLAWPYDLAEIPPQEVAPPPVAAQPAEPTVVPEPAAPVEPSPEPAEATPVPDPDPVPAEPMPEPVPEPVLPPLRKFSDSTGEFVIEARVKSLTNGVVTLEKGDGTTVKVPREKLSAESQDLVEEFIRSRRR